MSLEVKVIYEGEVYIIEGCSKRLFIEVRNKNLAKEELDRKEAIRQREYKMKDEKNKKRRKEIMSAPLNVQRYTMPIKKFFRDEKGSQRVSYMYAPITDLEIVE